MARVVLENLSKRFKRPGGEDLHAVEDACLTVEDGEFLVLIGPSGCGKTTTLRLIAGLEDITSGTITLDGQVLNEVPPKDRDLAMVFQNLALYPHMTAYENMAFGLKLRKYSASDIEERINRATSILDLRECLSRLPEALSGGQRQRVALGRAIVRQPKVFLFDEPLSNLDARLRSQMRRELAALHDRLGTTMIYVTHDQVEAMTLGDRIAVMRNGIIQQVAEPMKIYQKPANMFVGGFIGSPPMNFFQGTLKQKDNALVFEENLSLTGPNKDVPGFSFAVPVAMTPQLHAHAGRAVVLGIRPEHINYATSENVEAVSAFVENVESLGAETHVYARSGGHSFIVRLPPNQKPALQQRVSFALDAAHIHFFDPLTELAILV